ncbi:MAG: hypothetical protein IT520_05745 [Burkholderiales bacterium]|nr:hypothetical protein [Burkholderiales bacterium]
MSVEIFLLLAVIVVGLGLLVRRQDARNVREAPKRPPLGAPTIQGGRGAVYPGASDDPMLPPSSAARAFSSGASKVHGSAAAAAPVATGSGPAQGPRPEASASASESGERRTSGDGTGAQGDGDGG